MYHGKGMLLSIITFIGFIEILGFTSMTHNKENLMSEELAKSKIRKII